MSQTDVTQEDYVMGRNDFDFIHDILTTGARKKKIETCARCAQEGEEGSGNVTLGSGLE